MRILLFILSWLLPATAWAAATDQAGFNSTVYKLTLTPPPTDVSLNYLGYVFGNVDGVLLGAGSQVLGTMFGVFNAAVLSLGGIILMYILLVSTLNTAHEGEVMGKKWSSIWIPLRSAIGVGLLVPKASGYSAIQIFMMWIIVQGIGAADSVWNAATGYLQSGGVLVSRPTVAGVEQIIAAANNNTGFINNMLQSLTCVASIQGYLQTNYENELKKVLPGGVRPSLPPNLFASIDFKQNPISVPGKVDSANYEQVCGAINWSEVPVGSIGTGSETDSAFTGYSAEQVDMLKNARSIAIRQMMTDLYPSAVRIVEYGINSSLSKQMSIIDYVNPLILKSAAATYSMLTEPAFNIQFVDATIGSQQEQMKADGWLMAGSYFNIITRTNTIGTRSDPTPPSFKPAADSASVSKALDNKPGGGPGGDITRRFASSNTPYNVIVDAAANIKGPSSTGRTVQALPITSLLVGMLPAGLSNIFNTAAKTFDRGFKVINDALQFLFSSDSAINAVSPLTKIAITGTWIILIVQNLLFILMQIIAAGAALSIVPWFALGTIAIVISQWIIPVLIPLLMAFLVFGATMAFYIPMVPYLVFTFASLGWFFAVIEAMIAAPLVALGLVHPEGHEAFGRAESSILLIVNVFLTPTLLIFGFVSAIIMSYIALWLLNKGFAYIYFTSVLSRGMMPSLLGIVIALLVFIMMYTMTALTIVQKCFELIHIIPQRVMMWIGHTGATDYGTQQSVGEVKGGVQGGLEKGTGAVGAAMKERGEATAKRIDKELSQANHEQSAELENTSSKSNKSDPQQQSGSSGKPPLQAEPSGPSPTANSNEGPTDSSSELKDEPKPTNE